MTCHSCDRPLTPDNWLPDTCDECLLECLCGPCRELRADIAEDRREQLALDAWRETA